MRRLKETAQMKRALRLILQNRSEPTDDDPSTNEQTSSVSDPHSKWGRLAALDPAIPADQRF
jgi:hypothetical protein